MRFINKTFLILTISLAILLVGCAPSAAVPTGSIQVVATTNILADIVLNVGGEHIQLETLLDVGVDPHSFDPAARDLVALEHAELIFINGLGLEETLSKLLEGQDFPGRLVSVSDGIPALDFGEAHAGNNEHGGLDPHVWMDPRNVVLWVEVISFALSEADPANANSYQQNAASYTQELLVLHDWIVSEVGTLTPEKRLLVTDHDSLAYFAAAYGFEIIGTVIPSYSTLAEPSAHEVAALETAIRDFGVHAVFVDISVSRTIIERLAADTGVQLVPIYTGSLSAADGPAPSYLEMMRYDVTAIVSALK